MQTSSPSAARTAASTLSTLPAPPPEAEPPPPRGPGAPRPARASTIECTVSVMHTTVQ
ncbi:hypothetical protein [Streptomyces parvus]|uniref:hypothetical protein n=1 Tax=Streptomyces parvus TaxID=66428 RepID=UPI00339BC16E